MYSTPSKMCTTSCINPTVMNPFTQEHILINKSETFHNKIKALIISWGELVKLKYQTTDNFMQLIGFLKNHTLDIVLSAEWSRFKDEYSVKLTIEINKCHNVFGHLKGFRSLCHKVTTIAGAPWTKTVRQMLYDNNPVITIEEYNFFVHEESGFFISMRLKKLCDEGCEDIALNLTRTYVKCCEWAELHNLNMYITVDQKRFVLDVYLALLYKFDDKSEMSALLRNTTLPEGIDTVRRFRFKVKAASKIWTNSVAIAQFTGTVFLTRGVILPLDESSSFIIELLDTWLPTYSWKWETDELVACLRRAMKHAVTSSHMYFVLKRLLIRFGSKLRCYYVEICLQALNIDLNLLEKLKTEADIGQTVEDITERLADGFMEMAGLLSDNVYVSRECILSAFSLKPSKTMLREIELLALETENTILDTQQWNCKFHPPCTEDCEQVVCTRCGDFMPKLKIDMVIKVPNNYLIEGLRQLRLSEQLCDDLAAIIFSPRYRPLSWQQNWNDLHRLCIMYLDDPDGTKNFITELKFLYVDYTPFLLKRALKEAENQMLAQENQDPRVKKKRRNTKTKKKKRKKTCEMLILRNRRIRRPILERL